MRHRLRVTCRYPVVFESQGHVAEGHVVNLSLLGCAIEIQDCCLYGVYLRLHVLLPDEAMRIDLCKVRWLRTDQLGVEFLSVPDHRKYLMGRIIRQEVQATS